jgi:hypothetical protein
MAGILDQLGGLLTGMGQSGPFTNYLGDNRNALMALGLGLASGNGWGEGAKNALTGFVAGQGADRGQRGQIAALKYVMGRDDIPPEMKQAMLANPELALKFFGEAAKPPQYKTDFQDGNIIQTRPDRPGFSVAGQTPRQREIEGRVIETPAPTPIPNSAQRSQPVPGSLYQGGGGPYGGSPATNPNLRPVGEPQNFDDRFSAAGDNPRTGQQAPGVRAIYDRGPKEEQIAKLSDDWRGDKIVQRWQKIEGILPSLQEARQRPGGAADLNIIYGMATIFDPDSVVREAEQIMGRKTGGPVESAQALVEWVKTGGILTPEVRNRLMTELESRAGAARRQYETANKFYEGRARRLGVDPAHVFYNSQMYDAPTNAPDQPVPTEMENKRWQLQQDLQQRGSLPGNPSSAQAAVPNSSPRPGAGPKAEQDRLPQSAAPPEIIGKSMADQMRAAPVGSVMNLYGRRIQKTPEGWKPI